MEGRKWRRRRLDEGEEIAKRMKRRGGNGEEGDMMKERILRRG